MKVKKDQSVVLRRDKKTCTFCRQIRNSQSRENTAEESRKLDETRPGVNILGKKVKYFSFKAKVE